METKGQPPVLVVHGMWDSAERVAPLTEALRVRGLNVHAFDQPSRGHVPIAELAEITRGQVERVCAEQGAKQVDVVGFSMGALNARYYVQRLGGRERVRRFIAMSGPQQGTVMAHLLPFPGIVDMRPGSPLLQDLARDHDPWGPVEVHVIYTPFDLTIVPAHSSELRGARSTHRIPVVLHRLMLHDTRVHDLIARLLRQ